MSVYADLRNSLWAAWERVAEGSKADPDACRAAQTHVLEAEAVVGEPEASALRQHAAEEWHELTGCCPACGERGPVHPADGSGAEPEPPASAETVRAWRNASWAQGQKAH